jgi:hypothetical protein
MLYAARLPRVRYDVFTYRARGSVLLPLGKFNVYGTRD